MTEGLAFSLIFYLSPSKLVETPLCVFSLFLTFAPFSNLSSLFTSQSIASALKKLYEMLKFDQVAESLSAAIRHQKFPCYVTFHQIFKANAGSDAFSDGVYAAFDNPRYSDLHFFSWNSTTPIYLHRAVLAYFFPSLIWDFNLTLLALLAYSIYHCYLYHS